MSPVRFRCTTLLGAFTLTAALVALIATGCGGGGGGIDLADCGNGRLDGGEACDDGNLEDNDACLSTCQSAECGDGFLNTGVEQCEIGNVPTCQSLGFQSGTVDCTASCTPDTSGCSGNAGPTPLTTATPIASATAGGPTATTGDRTSTPTPQPTPAGGSCSGSESIVVVLALDESVTSARLDVGYPASANLPGTGPDQSVKERVSFAGSGLSVVNDVDRDSDLIDDTVTASLVGTDLVPAGPFATITFDCVPGQPVPTAADFTCTVVSASSGGTSATPGCVVSLP